MYDDVFLIHHLDIYYLAMILLTHFRIYETSKSIATNSRVTRHENPLFVLLIAEAVLVGETGLQQRSPHTGQFELLVKDEDEPIMKSDQVCLCWYGCHCSIS